MKSRVEEAETNFMAGYNCCQSVFATYADLFGMDKDMALRLASPMGAGVGRMREVCGVVSAMAMLVGLKDGNTNPTCEEKKTQIYQKVRELSDIFSAQSGSIICRELLAISEREESAKPSERTKSYYETRPCKRLVVMASQIVEEMLIEEVSCADNL